MPQQNTQTPGFFLQHALNQSIGGRKITSKTDTATDPDQSPEQPTESAFVESSNPLSAQAYQVGGNHYQKMSIQPISFISANNLGFCEGNAIKYICRYKDKGGVQDLKKAIHYLELLIERHENE